MNKARLLIVFLFLVGLKCASGLAAKDHVMAMISMSVTEGQNANFLCKNHTGKTERMIFGKISNATYSTPCFNTARTSTQRNTNGVETRYYGDEVCKSFNRSLEIPNKEELDDGSAKTTIQNVTLPYSGVYFTDCWFDDKILGYHRQEYNLTVKPRPEPATTPPPCTTELVNETVHVVTTPPPSTTEDVKNQATIILMNPIFVAVLLCINRFIG